MVDGRYYNDVLHFLDPITNTYARVLKLSPRNKEPHCLNMISNKQELHASRYMSRSDTTSLERDVKLIRIKREKNACSN